MRDQPPLRELLLASAAKLGTFTVQELTVQAWQDYPDRFCIQGFPQYPCHNKVLCLVIGERGLIKRGAFVRVGNKLQLKQPGNLSPQER